MSSNQHVGKELQTILNIFRNRSSGTSQDDREGPSQPLPSTGTLAAYEGSGQVRSPNPRPSVGLFNRSRRTRVQDSHINATTNHGSIVVNGPCTILGEKQPSELTLEKAVSEVSESSSASENQKSDSDIYIERMRYRGRGFPMWVPGPSLNLPLEYRREGPSPGDVGVIHQSSGFSFLFNIFLPADHPINAGKVPPSFSPLHTVEGRDYYDRSVIYHKNSYLASSSVRQSQNADTMDMMFQTSSNEGALLIMPGGAISVDKRDLVHVEKYMMANLQSWYSYLIHERCWRIENGDIRLVTGFDKVPAWGIASFAHRQELLAFRGPERSELSQEGKWIVGSGRHGPLDIELEDLKSPTDSTVLWNQRTFLRSFNPTLNPDAWKEMLEVVVDIEGQSGIAETNTGTLGSPSQSGAQHAVASGSSHTNPPCRSHPSTVLNNRMLQKYHRETNSSARAVVSHDFHWSLLMLASQIFATDSWLDLIDSFSIRDHIDYISLELPSLNHVEHWSQGFGFHHFEESAQRQDIVRRLLDPQLTFSSVAQPEMLVFNADVPWFSDGLSDDIMLCIASFLPLDEISRLKSVHRVFFEEYCRVAYSEIKLWRETENLLTYLGDPDTMGPPWVRCLRVLPSLVSASPDARVNLDKVTTAFRRMRNVVEYEIQWDESSPYHTELYQAYLSPLLYQWSNQLQKLNLKIPLEFVDTLAEVELPALRTFCFTFSTGSHTTNEIRVAYNGLVVFVNNLDESLCSLSFVSTDTSENMDMSYFLHRLGTFPLLQSFSLSIPFDGGQLPDPRTLVLFLERHHEELRELNLYTSMLSRQREGDQPPQLEWIQDILGAFHEPFPHLRSLGIALRPLSHPLDTVAEFIGMHTSLRKLKLMDRALTIHDLESLFRTPYSGPLLASSIDTLYIKVDSLDPLILSRITHMLPNMEALSIEANMVSDNRKTPVPQDPNVELSSLLPDLSSPSTSNSPGKNLKSLSISVPKFADVDELRPYLQLHFPNINPVNLQASSLPHGQFIY